MHPLESNFMIFNPKFQINLFQRLQLHNDSAQTSPVDYLRRVQLHLGNLDI